MTDLIPCPFHKPQSTGPEVLSLAGDHKVVCVCCGISTKLFKTKQEAVEWWNTRPSQWRSVKDDPPADDDFILWDSGRFHLAVSADIAICAGYGQWIPIPPPLPEKGDD